MLSFFTQQKSSLKQPVRPSSNSRGFTLIESLVAISVLLLTVAGTLDLARKGIFATSYARNQISAVYLAQEGIEYIRSVRDTNAITGQSWLTGLSSCIGAHCTIDAPNNTVTSCGATACSANLRYDSSSHFYGYTSGWTPTYFKRDISIESISASEAVLTVTVFWQIGTLTRSFVAQENLFNWQL